MRERTTRMTNEMRDLARHYHSLGINIVPLGADKRPVITGVAPSGSPVRFRWEEWKEQRQSDMALRQILRPAWWSEVQGIAGVCGPVSGGLACIDFDKTSYEIVEAFLGTLGLDEGYAWQVRTPGGGWHVWLRYPPLTMDVGKLRREARGGGHVELRWAGHYTALPGSVHPSGGVYEWVGDEPEEGPVCLG